MAVKFMVVNFMDINFVAMNYYDREIPLKQLKAIRDKAFESFSKMTVLKGRRRIGKTTLGTLAFEGSDFVYLFVGRRSESDLCEDFSSEIRRVLGVFVPEGITRFKDIFGLLMSAGETRSFTLFIDEVQEFYYINKTVFSDIQDVWDRTRRKTHVNLVFSGSTFTLMEKIFKDEHEPLFGRADLTLELEPFSTSVQKSILADHKADYNNDDLLALYCFTGGVPKYIELLMDNGCLNLDSMVDYMTTPGSQFLDEGEKILIQEMGKNYGTYFSILARISSGEVTLPEIEGSLGDKSLGGQIRILEEEYKLISKKRPIRSAENSGCSQDLRLFPDHFQRSPEKDQEQDQEQDDRGYRIQSFDPRCKCQRFLCCLFRKQFPGGVSHCRQDDEDGDRPRQRMIRHKEQDHQEEQDG